jgi:hypothetical protein
MVLGLHFAKFFLSRNQEVLNNFIHYNTLVVLDLFGPSGNQSVNILLGPFNEL